MMMMMMRMADAIGRLVGMAAKGAAYASGVILAAKVFGIL